MGRAVPGEPRFVGRGATGGKEAQKNKKVESRCAGSEGGRGSVRAAAVFREGSHKERKVHKEEKERAVVVREERCPEGGARRGPGRLRGNGTLGR